MTVTLITDSVMAHFCADPTGASLTARSEHHPIWSSLDFTYSDQRGNQDPNMVPIPGSYTIPDIRRYAITGGNNASMTTSGTDQYLAFWVQLAVVLDGILRRMPGVPARLHFFVFEPRALALHAGLLCLTGALAALYPIWIATRLPIAATLRREIQS